MAACRAELELMGLSEYSNIINTHDPVGYILIGEGVRLFVIDDFIVHTSILQLRLEAAKWENIKVPTMATSSFHWTHYVEEHKKDHLALLNIHPNRQVQSGCAKKLLFLRCVKQANTLLSCCKLQNLKIEREL